MAKPPSIKVMRGGSAVAEIGAGSEKKECERVLQPAGEEQQHCQLGYIEGRRRCTRPIGLEPLVIGNRMRSATLLSAAASAITARQPPIGNWYIDPKYTAKTAVVCR